MHAFSVYSLYFRSSKLEHYAVKYTNIICNFFSFSAGRWHWNCIRRRGYRSGINCIIERRQNRRQSKTLGHSTFSRRKRQHPAGTARTGYVSYALESFCIPALLSTCLEICRFDTCMNKLVCCSSFSVKFNFRLHSNVPYIKWYLLQRVCLSSFVRMLHLQLTNVLQETVRRYRNK
jgi:hypothetical protein